MSHRHSRVDPTDYFPTQPWATRALCEMLPVSTKEQSVWEPACGAGDMSLPLAEHFKSVFSSDVVDRGYGEVMDFLTYKPEKHHSFDDYAGEHEYDWIITNPPFSLAEEFIDQAISLAFVGVAMLVRTPFVEGVGRYRRLYQHRKPALILQFVERVPLFKGRLDPDGSTASAYCWMVWHADSALIEPKETLFRWIPPCRKRLELPEDYAPRVDGRPYIEVP